MPRILLNTAEYYANSAIANGQRCINLYPEKNIGDSPAPVTYYPTPGKKLWQTVPGTGEVRHLTRASNGVLFAVRGRTIYRFNGTNWLEIVSLETTTGRVYSSDNGINIIFVDGTSFAPTFNMQNSTVSKVGGDGWFGADFVYYFDGRFVFNKPQTQQFYWTLPFTSNVDALDFASSEGLPDEIVSMIVSHRELWLFGDRTIEIFYNSGDADQPFTRMQGNFNEYGCGAPYSVVGLDNTIFWFGEDANGSNLIFRAASYQPQIISTPAMSAEFIKYETTKDAIAYSYQQSGHSFYVITFPTAQKTWVFDVLTGQWHQRAYRTSDNKLIRDRGNCAVFFQNKNLVGDFQDGRIFELDVETYDDDGDVIYREKIFPHIINDKKWQFFDSFELDCEIAVGNESELSPQIWLSWQDNGGKDWSNPIHGGIGSLGVYNKILRFSRLGRSRDRVYKISTTMRAKFVMQSAFVSFSLSPNKT